MSHLPLIAQLAALAASGATTVTIEYNGSGDSGGIDRVVTDTGVPIDEETSKALEYWAWEHAIPRGEWESNEGATGTVELNLTTFEAVTRHIDFYAVDEESRGMKELRKRTPPAEVVAELAALASEYASLAVGCWTSGARCDTPAKPASVDLVLRVPRKDRTVEYRSKPETHFPSLYAWLCGVVADIRCGDDPATVNVMITLAPPYTARCTWTVAKHGRTEADPTYTVLN